LTKNTIPNIIIQSKKIKKTFNYFSTTMSKSTANKFDILSSKNQIKSDQLEIIEGIKKGLLKNMKLENKMIKRDDIEKKIKEQREKISFPNDIEIVIGKTKEAIKNSSNSKYKDILQQYKEINQSTTDKEIKLKKLDKQLAEQVILNSGNMIEFSSKETYESGKTAEEEARDCYERLNKIERFNDKIELIKKILKEESFFVIKRTKKQLDKIEKELTELEIAEKQNSSTNQNKNTN